jgi:hypothetical protein
MSDTWENNPQYLAQVGHTLGGFGALATTCMVSLAVLLRCPVTSLMFAACEHNCLIVLVVGVVAAAVKEFGYDAHYELPKQTFADNLMDFSFYVLGGLLGLGLDVVTLHWLATHLHP